MRALERGPFPEFVVRVAVAIYEWAREVSMQSRLVDSGSTVFEHVLHQPKERSVQTLEGDGMVCSCLWCIVFVVEWCMIKYLSMGVLG